MTTEILYQGEESQKSRCLNGKVGYPNIPSEMDAKPSRENQLIERAQSGELEAFNELVLTYQDRVYQQAFWMLQEEDSANDAAQETFVKAYRKFHTFRHGKSFRAWLLRIASNHCLDMIRAAKRHPEQPLEPTGPDGETLEPYWIKDFADTPEQAVEKIELERRIATAIQHLSPEYRTTVILVDLQELDYAEASVILKVPLGTIKSRLSRARHQLRKALQ